MGGRRQGRLSFEALIWQKRAIVELLFINTLSTLLFMQTQRGFVSAAALKICYNQSQ